MPESKMDPHLDFSLQRLSLISWSASFWNRPKIINKVIRISNKVYDRENFNKITLQLVDMAKQELKAKNLPSVMYGRLIQTVISVGLRILMWYYNIRHGTFSVSCRYTEEFYWTAFGTIDEAKTVQINWFERSYVFKVKTFEAYYMICSSVSKDYVNRHAQEILDFCNGLDESSRVDFVVCSVLTLAGPEHLKLSEKSKNKLIRKHFKNFKSSKEAYMFLFSVRRGHLIAAQHYWQDLDLSEKEEMLASAIICLDGHLPIQLSSMLDSLNCSLIWPMYDIWMCTDVLVFILTKMSRIGNKEWFLSKKYNRGEKTVVKILDVLIRSCAWEEYFFALFDLFKEEIEMKDYCILLESITGTLYQRRRIGLDLKNTVYDQMFTAVWRKMGGLHSKIQLTNSRGFIRNVFKIFDLDVIKELLEESGIFRKPFLLIGCKQYKTLMEADQFELLDKFMQTVLRSDAERKWFKHRLKYFNYFIDRGELDVATYLLNWLASSQKERKMMKFGLDVLSICAKRFATDRFSWKKGYIWVEKILFWMFRDGKEKNEYINKYMSSNMKWLYKLWLNNKNNFINCLSKFLKFFFKTEIKDTRYKIKNLLTENVLRNFFEQLKRKRELEKPNYGCMLVRNALETVGELMEFCLPDDDIVKLKAEIVKNIDKWLLLLTKDKSKCWGSLDRFLNWVSGFPIKGFVVDEVIVDHERKRELVKKYLLSADGKKFLEIISSSSDLYKNYEKYLCLWIKWTGGCGAMENLQASLSENSRYNGVINMLENLSIGESSEDTIKHCCFLNRPKHHL